MSLKIGDVVKLKGARDLMTVSKIADTDQEVQCMWFKDQEVKSSFFPEETLELIR